MVTSLSLSTHALSPPTHTLRLKLPLLPPIQNYCTMYYRYYYHHCVCTTKSNHLFSLVPRPSRFSTTLRIFRVYHMTSATGPSRFSACNIEKLGRACGRGYPLFPLTHFKLFSHYHIPHYRLLVCLAEGHFSPRSTLHHPELVLFLLQYTRL